jgi:hypothetical protein
MCWNHSSSLIRLAAVFLFSFVLHSGAVRAQQEIPDAPSSTLAMAQQATQTAPAAQAQETGYISGTVMDAYEDVVVGATAVLDDGTPADQRAVESNDSGTFQFSGVRPGVTYHVTVRGKGFVDWSSKEIVIKPGEFFMVAGIQLKLADASTSVTVYADSAQIATEQVNVEYHQKVLGFIPNYYVVYDSQSQPIAPMTTKLKYQMAFKVATDPVNFAGAIFLGAVDQASDSPNYPQGWKGYGERVGANYADGFTDIMFGGAILPALLKQDPRYYYQGTGTTGSRLKHALSYPFICKGDNGKLQPNYSTMGGDLISSSLSNLYYPPSNRGAGLVFTNFAVGTAERALSTVLQEFVLRRLTPGARKEN